MASEWKTIYAHEDHPISIRYPKEGFKIYLRIGEGKRCRRAKLGSAEMRRVANALASAAESREKQLGRLKQKASRAQTD